MLVLSFCIRPYHYLIAAVSPGLSPCAQVHKREGRAGGAWMVLRSSPARYGRHRIARHRVPLPADAPVGTPAGDEIPTPSLMRTLSSGPFPMAHIMRSPMPKGGHHVDHEFFL